MSTTTVVSKTTKSKENDEALEKERAYQKLSNRLYKKSKRESQMLNKNNNNNNTNTNNNSKNSSSNSIHPVSSPDSPLTPAAPVIKYSEMDNTKNNDRNNYVTNLVIYIFFQLDENLNKQSRTSKISKKNDRNFKTVNL